MKGENDIDFSDGNALAKSFHNRTFVVATGNAFLDSSGARTIPIIVRKLNDVDLGFQVGNYCGHTRGKLIKICCAIDMSVVKLLFIGGIYPRCGALPMDGGRKLHVAI